MTNHLKNKHHKVFSEFTNAKVEKDTAEKRKLEEGKEEDEMEGGTVPLFNLRTQNQRQEFLHQTNLNSLVSFKQRVVNIWFT